MTTDNEEQQRAVIASYYGRLITRGDVLRQRMQGAYATISTVAGGLIGVGLLTNLSSLSNSSRALGLFAAGAWMIAALGFTLAATTSINVADDDDDRTLTKTILDQVRMEQKKLKSRFTAALVLGGLAVALTALTLFISVEQFPPNSASDVRIQLAPSGVDLILAQCNATRSSEVVVDVRGLTSASNFLDIVIVEGPGRGCHVLLPRASAMGFKLD